MEIQREHFYSFLETIRVIIHSIAAIVSLLLTSDRKSSRCSVKYRLIKLNWIFPGELPFFSLVYEDNETI